MATTRRECACSCRQQNPDFGSHPLPCQPLDLSDASVYCFGKHAFPWTGCHPRWMLKHRSQLIKPMEVHYCIRQGRPAKRALSAMRKHGGEGPFWQDTLDVCNAFVAWFEWTNFVQWVRQWNCQFIIHCSRWALLSASRYRGNIVLNPVALLFGESEVCA